MNVATGSARSDGISLEFAGGDAPRVLFLGSEPPNLGAAGSIYFHRLFLDWPAERLRVVTHRPVRAGVETLQCEYASFSMPLERLNRTRLWKWRTSLRVVGANRALTPLNAIVRCVGRFEPDVVVTLMQDSWMYDVAARYAAQIGKPLVAFVHDLAHGFEPVPSVLRSLQLRRDQRFLRRCRLVLSVSPGMQCYLRRELGIESEVLLPPRDESPPSQSIEECRQLKTPGRLTLGYAGGLHYGYGEQLLRMLPVLRATGTFIHAYGDTPSGGLSALAAAGDVFRFHGRLPTPQLAWREILRHCDAVLLPYLNPPGEHALQYRTHFPSKLGDMLALGLPILATGPADASGVHWLAAHSQSALCVTDDSNGALEKSLCHLRDDADCRIRLTRSAQSLSEEFEVRPLAGWLRRSLKEIALTDHVL